MKAFLMYKDQDFDPQRKLPSNEQALTQDLELNTLLNAMSLDDKFLFDVANKAMLGSLNDASTILYRQNILRDCLKNSSIVKDIYNIAVDAIEKEKKQYWWGFSSGSPHTILFVSVEALKLFVDMLKKLRNIADLHANKFDSEGFTALFAMLQHELTDEYFAEAESHLKHLKFRNGVLISAGLGKGNKGTHYILHNPEELNQSWMMRIFAKLQQFLAEKFFGKKPPSHTFYLHPRDEAGARAIEELRDRGINSVANALAQSKDHVLGFLNMLRTELAFYMGCLNLHKQLTQIGEPLSFPYPMTSDTRHHSFKGLYDVCLALHMKQKIVGNDVNADNKSLVIISGANQGGKSTFLRSIGLSQLMMQCGMFVPAESFSANICDALFTHYKREEDITMKSGKLDEEFSRMNDIADQITPNSLLLFNESFAATNEREGSEISRQIVSALLEKHIKIFFVTHLYEFAHDFYDKKMEPVIFLQAERKTDGRRTYKLIEGKPLQTSYGIDLYNRIFGYESHH